MMKSIESHSATPDKVHSHLDEVNMIGKLADLKIEHEKISLLISTMIELLVEKGVFSRDEFNSKAAQLDKTPVLKS